MGERNENDNPWWMDPALYGPSDEIPGSDDSFVRGIDDDTEMAIIQNKDRRSRRTSKQEHDHPHSHRQYQRNSSERVKSSPRDKDRKSKSSHSSSPDHHHSTKRQASASPSASPSPDRKSSHSSSPDHHTRRSRSTRDTTSSSSPNREPSQRRSPATDPRRPSSARPSSSPRRTSSQRPDPTSSSSSSLILSPPATPPRHNSATSQETPSSLNSLAETLRTGMSRLKKKLSEFSLDKTHRSSSLAITDSEDTDNNVVEDYQRYSVSELLHSLGSDTINLPPALERRVRDFKFAQEKRRERHGEKKPWGIFGLYAHLSDIRADLEWAEDAAWRRQRQEPYLSWSDFEKSRDKGLHNRPWFTYFILFLSTLVMFVTFGVNGWKFEPLTVNPMIGPSAETLVKCGARDTNLIVNEGEWYRLFSPLILHAGLIHYFINMLALWFIGAAVEQSHGIASATVLFIIPAVGGNILSAICLPQYISVGASGGIFGLIGGCVADVSLNWNLLFLKTATPDDTRWRHMMVLFWLGFDIVLNCLLGFTPFVDNFTHLGGFLYGLCCGLSTMDRLAVGFFGLSNGSCEKVQQTLWRFLGLIISVVAIMVTTILLVQSDGVTSPCHGCRFISCLPFPPNAEEKWWYCDDCDFVTADLFVAADGSGLLEKMELHCPSGDIQDIVIYEEDDKNDKEALRKALPQYCRAHCDDVYLAHF